MSDSSDDHHYSQPDAVLQSAFYKERIQYHKNRLMQKPSQILTMGTVFAVVTGAVFKIHTKSVREIARHFLSTYLFFGAGFAWDDLYGLGQNYYLMKAKHDKGFSLPQQLALPPEGHYEERIQYHKSRIVANVLPSTVLAFATGLWAGVFKRPFSMIPTRLFIYWSALNLAFSCVDLYRLGENYYMFKMKEQLMP